MLVIYENVEGKFLDFLHNPVCNAAMLNKGFSSSVLPSFLYRLMSYFKEHSAIDNFELYFLKKLANIEHEIASINKKCGSDDVLEREVILSSLSKYLSIEIHSIERENELPISKEQLSVFKEKEVFVKFEYHFNRLSEHFNIDGGRILQIVKNKNIWILFYLSEIYFLYKQGMLEASYSGKKITFTMPDTISKTRFKSYWLSEILESLSQQADKEMLKGFSEFIQRGRLEFVATNLVEQVLDKIFSIKPKYLDKSQLNSEQYILMKDLICIYSVIYSLSLKGVKNISATYFINSGLVKCSSLTFVQKHLNQIHRKFKGVYSTIELNGSEFTLGNFEFKFGIRYFVGELVLKKQKEVRGKDFPGELGDIFDKVYVSNYLKSLDGGFLTVFPEFQPSKSNKSSKSGEIKGYDIDVVVRDNRTEQYYFIQVKYLLSKLPKFLSERIYNFKKDSIGKGFDPQLLQLKNNFNDPLIREKLKNHGLDKATLENSHFVLLHNLPYLNFYKAQGVLFFEWNLARNILKNGKIYWYEEGISGSTSSSEKLELFDMEKIVESYFSNKKFGRELTTYFELNQRSRLILKDGKMVIDCPLL